MPLRTRPQLEYRQKMGPGPPPQACERARSVKCFLPAKFSGLTLYRVRELGIRGRTPNAGKRTPFPTPRRRRPDLVRHDFNSPVPTYKLVGDITYLRTREGRLYLSTVIDPNTHMVVGRSLSARFDGRHRGIGAGVGKIARLRGRQRHIPRRPRRPARQQAFVRVGARQRRAADLQPHRTGSCHDNAVAESFFAPLKNEMYYRRSIPTRDSPSLRRSSSSRRTATAAGPTRRSATRRRPRLWKSSSNAQRPSPKSSSWPPDFSGPRVRNLDTGHTPDSASGNTIPG